MFRRKTFLVVDPAPGRAFDIACLTEKIGKTTMVTSGCPMGCCSILYYGNDTRIIPVGPCGAFWYFYCGTLVFRELETRVVVVASPTQSLHLVSSSIYTSNQDQLMKTSVHNLHIVCRSVACGLRLAWLERIVLRITDYV